MKYFSYICNIKLITKTFRNMQIVKLDNTKKGIIWSLIEKYDGYHTRLSDSLSNVLLGKETIDDMLVIANHMDFRDIDEEDFHKLEDTIGPEVDAALFMV